MLEIFSRLIRQLHDWLALRIGLASLGIGCLLWSVSTLPVSLIWKGRKGIYLGRYVAYRGFRLYLRWLELIGVAHFDLSELDQLRNAGPVILAPNHPSLLDALMVISRLPNVTCVLKASLLDSILWGSGARLAGYIRNDWFIGSINLAVAELHQGSQLLLFPEGTRTENPPTPNAFKAGAAYVAHRAQVPIQTILIDTDSNFLGKKWSLFKRPNMPLHYRIRLGRRFGPPEHPETFVHELQAYFADNICIMPKE